MQYHADPSMSAAKSTSLRMSYRIGRGEVGVLTFEPYKSALLPLWRFRTVPIARESSSALWERFLNYEKEGDFVGMDMSRKFIQMGMTRAKRYANYKGGRKYIGGKETGVQKEKSAGHEGKDEKELASLVFKEIWERCRVHEGYLDMKKEFQGEQKEWDRLKKEDKAVAVKTEVKEATNEALDSRGDYGKGIHRKSQRTPKEDANIKIETD